MIIQAIGVIFVVIGTIVSLIFWVPGLIDKKKLKEIMGPRYNMVYFIYFSNGPFLLALGAFILTFLV